MHEDRRPRGGEEAFGLACWRGRPYLMDEAHRHGEVELNLVERGTLTYLFGGEPVALEAGRLAVFWGAFPHRVAGAGSDATLAWLTLPLASFLRWGLPDALVQPVLYGRPVLEPDPARARGDRAAFVRWASDLRSGSAELERIVLLEVEARLRRLAHETGSAEKPGARRAAPGGEGLDPVGRLAAFVAERHAEPLTLTEVAAAAGLHPNYAATLFKRTLGVTVVEYLTQHRVAHAQRLLATTDLPILDVALDAGFGSVSRFYTAFQRACQATPREYRRLVRPAAPGGKGGAPPLPGP